MKLAGDVGSLFSGIMETLQNAFKLVGRIKSGGGDNAKAKSGGTRRDLEAVGNTLNDYTGTVASLAGNFRTVTKLAFQIQDKGQVSAESANKVADRQHGRRSGPRPDSRPPQERPRRRASGVPSHPDRYPFPTG